MRQQKKHVNPIKIAFFCSSELIFPVYVYRINLFRYPDMKAVSSQIQTLLQLQSLIIPP